MNENTKTITGVLSVLILAVGVGIVGASAAPAVPSTQAAPFVKVPPPVAVDADDDSNLDAFTVVDDGFAAWEAEQMAKMKAADPNGDVEPVNPNGPGYYAVWNKRPAGIVIYQIIFHEGFRAPGLKAVDVHIIARSQVNGEYRLIQGRDEIVSITGSTGKVYSMIGTKRTGVNGNAVQHGASTFEEQEITEYQDVSVNEKAITSIVVRFNGKLLTIKPDKDTQTITTHA